MKITKKLDKHQSKLASKCADELELLINDLAICDNLRSDALRGALNRTVTACGLVRCEHCKSYGLDTMPGSGLCDDCFESDAYPVEHLRHGTQWELD